MAALKDMDLLDGAEEELAVSNPQQRNWRGILIALLVIATMSSLIALAVLILTPLNDGITGPHLKMSLKDVMTLNFQSPVESADWLDDHRLLVKQSETVELIDLSQPTNSSARNTALLNSEILYRYGKINTLAISPDEKFIIVSYAPTKKSPKSVFRVFDRKRQTFTPVGPTKNGEENVKVLVWSPTGNDFAFVSNNDIHYQSSPSAKESTRITRDASFHTLNGVSDWIYEEEILGSSQAMWWSKDGSQLAFLRIDNGKVPHVEIDTYGQQQYPTKAPQSYPKTGSSHLPIASLHIWKKADGRIRQCNLTTPTPDQSTHTYLFSASWLVLHGQQTLLAVWANRFQNSTTMTLCTYASGKCVETFSQRYAFGALRLWAEPDDTKVRFHSTDAYFTLLPHRRPSGNAYTQVAKVSVLSDLTGAGEAFLSMGDYDVDSIDHFDEKNNQIYFTAAAPAVSQRHLYVISASPTDSLDAHCVTCNVSSNCSFHETSFAPSGPNSTYLYLSCKGPGTPHLILGKIDHQTGEFEIVSEYGRNAVLEHALTTHLFPSVKHDNVTLKNGVVSQVKMLLPYGLKNHMMDRRYPVLVDVYAGPGTQKATEEWLSSSIDIYFASSQEYVVVFIDGRGSGQRGWDVKAPLYGELGTVEVDDQIYTVRELLKRYPFLDGSRVGIWGWSYGGFVSARSVQRDNNSTFRCAASVAPVTHFKYYDATYTERYMAGAGAEAYTRTDLSTNVTAFHKVPFLLVHGTGDDNVHFQNTAEFVRALTDSNVQFELMIYTDEGHSLANGRWHLYNLLSNFFARCFAP